MSNLKKIRGTIDKQKGRLRGRFKWLLEEMCRQTGVDVQMIDPTLDYFENKRNIEEQARKKLFLKPEKREPEEEEAEIERVERIYGSA